MRVLCDGSAQRTSRSSSSPGAYTTRRALSQLSLSLSCSITLYLIDLVGQANSFIRCSDSVPDNHLVMTGPKAGATAARGQTRPLVITEVFLFDAPEPVKRLRELGVRLGVATYVRQHEWDATRVYPEAAPGNSSS